ncbi:hypothetical protein [Mycobacterium haemophilum]|uniref:Uncharacterized protein n=1 Tax=Mycobacterium haemophilum TaxID=29311 RepID=A0A0I9XYS4_9MYCO|nr:hypothetical protein [Mycobacterium haemophilum]KLO32347.1 hypothetical protein ABH39_06505 [Mycobacterium haemophilum]KLO38560.1 hypothetical protein ABH38_04080 [Mycobacterium haemophilum]KLO44895.1 hypothetical protein ABH37_02975 [Mycobacterium haemophilum]KLO56237.1 hypothetical protein ABH36_02955 [Mycobacterium haemophilum]
MTTHDDTAQTWRDVADQLTAAQIAQLERLERDEPQTLLEMAREWAAMNISAPMPFDDVAPPAPSSASRWRVCKLAAALADAADEMERLG